MSSTATAAAAIATPRDAIDEKNRCVDLQEEDASAEAALAPLAKRATRRGEKGRRNSYGKHYQKTVARHAAILKTVEDPDHVLGKRRKARLFSESSDGLEDGVFYSLNRKNRWAETDAETLLDNAQGSDVESGVVEHLGTLGCWGQPVPCSVVAYHTKNAEDGSLETRTAKRGTTLANLAETTGRRSRRSSKKSESEEPKEAAEPRTPKVLYNIVKNHPNVTVLSSGAFHSDKNHWDGKARNKRVPIEDLDESEMENSVHQERDDEEDLYKPSRDFRFSLGDFITTKNPAAVLVRRKSIESVKEPERAEAVEELPKPFDLLDISTILRTPALFETVNLNVGSWENFNFAQQIEQLAADSALAVRWLDDEKKRVSVDASKKTRAVQGDVAERLVLIVVFERSTKKDTIKLLVNSVVAPQGPFSWKTLKDLFKKNGVNSLASALEVVAKLVAQWRKSENEPSFESKSATTRYIAKTEAFHPSVNSALFARPASVLSETRMAHLVREECRREQEESFERIDDDELEAFSDTFETASSGSDGTPRVKCCTCLTNTMDDLFELDDCWQCRECLRQDVISQIRTGQLPVETPFIVGEGQSPFDVLPAVLPLPMFVHYSKLAATEILENSDAEVGDLIECPGCKQTVHAERPNEYGTINCTACGIHFCSECRSEPHWPMNCQQFGAWTEKWDKQYATTMLADQINTHMKRIHCSCGGAVIEVGDIAESAKCPSCRLEFNPSTMTRTEKFFTLYHPIARKQLKANPDAAPKKDVVPIKIENVPVTMVIKKEIAEICCAARFQRMDSGKINEFEKKIRKAKDIIPNADKLKELRKTVLLLVENGLGLVYLDKTNDEVTAIKAPLVQLMKHYEELVHDLDNARLSSETKIEQLEAETTKLIDLLKKTI